MKVTILGAGTGVPHPRRSAPGLVVECGSRLMLVDPSAGALQRMEGLGLSYRRLDTVVFSHYHPDHCGDLLSLIFAMFIDDRAPSELEAIGPPGLMPLIEGLTTIHGRWIAETARRLRVEESLEHHRAFQGGRLESAAVAHREHSLGYRWTEDTGAVFAYSGDSDECPGLLQLAQNADVALFEASHPHSLKKPGHLSGRLAGQLAVKAGVRQLVATHLYPEWDQADLESEVRQGGFQGLLAPAVDGMVIRLGEKG